MVSHRPKLSWLKTRALNQDQREALGHTSFLFSRNCCPVPAIKETVRKGRGWYGNFVALSNCLEGGNEAEAKKGKSERVEWEREREREKERERPGIKYEPVQARRLAPYVTSNQLWSPDSLQIDSVSITEASPPLFIYSPIRFMGIWPETAKKNSKPRRNHHQWVDRSPCNGCRRTELMRNLSIN